MNRIHIGPLDVYGCQEARQRLEPYIDGQLPASERRRVHFHIVICRHCAPIFRFESRLDNHIRHRLTQEQIPSDVRIKVQDALRAAQEDDSPPKSS